MTNPKECRELHLKELIWVSLGVPLGSQACILQEEICLGLQLVLEVPWEHQLQGEPHVGLQLVQVVPWVHQIQVDQLLVPEVFQMHLKPMQP